MEKLSSSVQDANQSPSSNSTTYDKRNNSEPSGWWIIGITAIYTIGSIGTLWIIWSQNRSIQNTERAILVPMWEDFVHLTPEAEGDRKHTFLVNFKNWGKTPAFIRGHQSNIVLLRSLADLPKKPKYRSEVIYKGDPLVPLAMTERSFYALLDGEQDFDDIFDEYRLKGKILYAFGYIRYDDIYGTEHCTWYGLRYLAGKTFSRDDGWMIAGPDSYNGYK